MSPEDLKQQHEAAQALIQQFVAQLGAEALPVLAISTVCWMAAIDNQTPGHVLTEMLVTYEISRSATPTTH